MTIAKGKLVIFENRHDKKDMFNGKIYDKSKDIFPFNSKDQSWIMKEYLLIQVVTKWINSTTLYNLFIKKFKASNKDEFINEIVSLRDFLEREWGLNIVNTKYKTHLILNLNENLENERIILISTKTGDEYEIKKGD